MVGAVLDKLKTKPPGRAIIEKFRKDLAEGRDIANYKRVGVEHVQPPPHLLCVKQNRCGRGVVWWDDVGNVLWLTAWEERDDETYESIKERHDRGKLLPRDEETREARKAQLRARVAHAFREAAREAEVHQGEWRPARIWHRDCGAVVVGEVRVDVKPHEEQIEHALLVRKLPEPLPAWDQELMSDVSRAVFWYPPPPRDATPDDFRRDGLTTTPEPVANAPGRQLGADYIVCFRQVALLE